MEPGAVAEHEDFFWCEASDPSEPCAQKLCELLKEAGTVVSYSHFEKTIFKQLAKKCPQYSTQLQRLSNMTVDLSLPFAQGFCCIPGSFGYSSIKRILPLIDPSMSYQNLAVSSGDNAILQHQNFLESSDPQVKQQKKHALRQYCAQDTFTMVKIYICGLLSEILRTPRIVKEKNRKLCIGL